MSRVRIPYLRPSFPAFAKVGGGATTIKSCPNVLVAGTYKCHHARTVFDSCPESEGTGVCVTHAQPVKVPRRCDSLVSANAGVAQLVEHFLAKEDVRGSNPLTRSRFSSDFGQRLPSDTASQSATERE